MDCFSFVHHVLLPGSNGGAVLIPTAFEDGRHNVFKNAPPLLSSKPTVRKLHLSIEGKMIMYLLQEQYKKGILAKPIDPTNENPFNFPLVLLDNHPHCFVFIFIFITVSDHNVDR